MTQIYNRPVLSTLDQQPSLYHRRTTQDSRPSELQKSYQSSNQYSDRREENDWKLSQPRSLMSDQKKGPAETSPIKAGNMFPSRPETNQSAPREQLPPLSSLFGSSTQGRPAQSPYSDRQSPVFPAVSPRDPRQTVTQPATPVHPDRPYETSYFQKPTTSHHHSYKSKPEPVERLGFQPPPPLPTQAGRRPESPRYEPRFAPQEPPRHQQTPSWSPQSQSRPEYFSRDTSSSFRPHNEPHRPHPPLHRPEPDRPAYRDHAPQTPSYPPTPASTAGEPTTKDGLGPKIWTGTQFLPRFVRQADVPGEGLCYFYDDGTHCKTVIDGEAVNAHWGVTKAGKPRKRLAIACITCREKKIKCDPDYPRCVQCEKFGRVCKFKNAPRGGQGSPDTPPADPEDLTRPSSSLTENDRESFKVEKLREDSHSVSPRQLHRHPSLDPVDHPSKRQRTGGYQDFTPVASEASPRPSLHSLHSPSSPWVEPLLPSHSPTNSTLLRSWQENPLTTQPALVSSLLETFFKHVPETAYCMFPSGPFKAWALSSSEKSLDDLMLIYTILALGTVFSPNPSHKAFGIQYASISRYACTNSQFSLQLVQSRLLLALYYFAINNPNDSWDFCGAAMRAASGLKLNLELENSDDKFLATFPYGLSRAGFAECRRRTFWCVFLMDRYNGFCSGHVSVIHKEDIFLRLPCDAKSFEEQAMVENSFFDPSTPAVPASSWTIGGMGYLINITAIWGDVMANIYRSSQRRAPSSSSSFAAFYEQTTRRLQDWSSSLPSHLKFSAQNLQRSDETGTLGMFMTMHTVFHTTAMKLNRYISSTTLSPVQVSHYISLAKSHAEEVLSMIDTLASFRRSSSLPSPISAGTYSVPLNGSPDARKFSSPFTGYAIVSAIDILTSKVRISSLRERLQSFKGCESVLGELAGFWQSAKNQSALIQQRIRELEEVREEDGVVSMANPIEKTFERGWDLCYS